MLLPGSQWETPDPGKMRNVVTNVPITGFTNYIFSALAMRLQCHRQFYGHLRPVSQSYKSRDFT